VEEKKQDATRNPTERVEKTKENQTNADANLYRRINVFIRRKGMGLLLNCIQMDTIPPIDLNHISYILQNSNTRYQSIKFLIQNIFIMTHF